MEAAAVTNSASCIEGKSGRGGAVATGMTAAEAASVAVLTLAVTRRAAVDGWFQRRRRRVRQWVATAVTRTEGAKKATVSAATE